MSIKLSPKHGVNPSISLCFYCGKEKNELVLAGKLKGDTQAPHQAVWDMEPCDQCRSWMEKGIILISVRDGTDPKNPYRTGGWVVLTEDAVRKLVSDPTILQQILTKRFVFIPDTVWKLTGLDEFCPQTDETGETDD